MRFGMKFSVALLILSALTLCACSAVARHHHALVHDLVEVNQTDDAISGEWNVSFFVNNQVTPATFKFKLDGTKVTGTAYSEHTGPGTIRDGVWENGNLSFTLDFKKHQSIVVKGAMKESKLIGEFSTEGFTSNWEAKRQ